jgi:hypothetical protein
MLPDCFLKASRIARVAPRSYQSADGSGKISSRGRIYLLALGIASIVALGLLLSGLGVFDQSATSDVSTTTTSTSYSVIAYSVIASAASNAPSVGYSQGSSKQLNPKESGLASGQYALFSDPGGDLANMTILVFNSTASAQRYIDSVIRNAKDLSGYSNANSTLTSYQQYGTCYGYAETDPGGGGSIATGVCTKGNVYIQVHIATSSSLPSAEGDMSSLVGIAYQDIG